MVCKAIFPKKEICMFWSLTFSFRSEVEKCVRKIYRKRSLLRSVLRRGVEVRQKSRVRFLRGRYSGRILPTQFTSGTQKRRHCKQRNRTEKSCKTAAGTKKSTKNEEITTPRVRVWLQKCVDELVSYYCIKMYTSESCNRR